MKSSRPYLEPHTTPENNYLKEELAVLNISGAQASILHRISRDTYGWIECPETKRRFDRAKISYQQLHERTGLPLRTVHRAMQDLIERNIVIQYQAGKGRRPSIFGINSNTDKWIGKRAAKNTLSTYPMPRAESRSSDKSGSTTSRSDDKSGSTTESRSSDKSGSTTSRSDDKSGSTTESNSESECIENTGSANRTKNALNQLLRKNTPYSPPEVDPPLDLITDSKKAKENLMISSELAYKSADKAYRGRFGRTLSPKEERDLREFLELSPLRGSLLAMFIDSLEPGYRRWVSRSKATPSEKRDISRKPYWNVRKCAANLYAKAKAKSSNRQLNERLTAA